MLARWGRCGVKVRLPFSHSNIIYNWPAKANLGTRFMPIFEYLCKGCGKQFEILLRGAEKPHCPKCNGTRLEQQLSAFAVATGHGNGGSAEFAPEPAPGCGQCGMGGGTCGLDDD